MKEKELKAYKDNEEFLRDIEEAILESIQESGPIDRSKLIEAAKNIDIFITNFL